MALALLLLALPAYAQEEAPGAALKRVEQEIQADKARQRALDQRSDAIRKETEDLRARLVGLAEQARAQEEELDGLEGTLRALEEEERQQATRLDGERQQIAHLLAALQRLSRIPPEVALARPEGPVDTLRSALLLRDTVPALRQRADALAAALNRLAEVRERLEGQRTSIVAKRDALGSRQQEIAALVARREELSRQTDEERIAVGRRMAALTGQASDLKQLMDRIEAERRVTMEAAARREAERLEAERRLARQREAEQREADRKLAQQKETEQKEAERQLAQQREAEQRARAEAAAQQAAVQKAPDPAPATAGNRLTLPVGGRIVTRFGEQDRFGATSRGLTISARPGTAVVAPYAGSVMFAGPFRGYGQILIVEHSNGYHSLIAGLGRIDTAVGKHVTAGEPIALMPADGSPDLYFELRRNGQPINPQRGAAAPEGKGQG
ncbi:murein hydrolase activator EnvC family protein [Azospirillum sp.]|uniref:murein hydrolase activator EnvC family protein n=1 Tax=Azospirillum sp. TaxID=34012 RepID=UPI002D73EF6E|nr:peptidoglycan DD-metalloendopeptidase family protein [Azospirillum sp.]HYD69744.1 peptidoglycan DD-metalloendopeptidase family protein [Azospirillum sp.]